METYIEIQKFKKILVWLILLFFIIVYIITLNLKADEVSGFERYFGLIITIAVAALIWFSRLETKINEKAVYIRFIPFLNKWKEIRWKEIKKAYIRKYSPLREYHGWGVRGFSRKNMAYNVSGSIGLQLELENGKKILVGTNASEKMSIYLNYIKNKYHISAINSD